MYPSNDNSDAGLRDFWLFHVGKVGYMTQLHPQEYIGLIAKVAIWLLFHRVKILTFIK